MASNTKVPSMAQIIQIEDLKKAANTTADGPVESWADEEPKKVDASAIKVGVKRWQRISPVSVYAAITKAPKNAAKLLELIAKLKAIPSKERTHWSQWRTILNKYEASLQCKPNSPECIQHFNEGFALEFELGLEKKLASKLSAENASSALENVIVTSESVLS